MLPLTFFLCSVYCSEQLLEVGATIVDFVADAAHDAACPWSLLNEWRQLG